MIVLVVITDGRIDYLRRTIASASEMLAAEWDARILVDDSGDPGHAAMIACEWPRWQSIHAIWRHGFAATVRAAWEAALAAGATYVLHLEEDFTFNQPINITGLIRLLNANPQLAQIALKRQPVNDRERSAGGFMQTWPESSWSQQNGFVEQTVNFTTNPCLIPARAIRRALASTEPLTEPQITRCLLEAGYRFGYLGKHDDRAAGHAYRRAAVGRVVAVIAATICVRGDGDIVQDTIRNMLDQGIDKVYAYTNGSEAFTAVADLGSPYVWAVRNTDTHFHQARLMDALANIAASEGAGWICPFDADEFWFGADGRSVADTLRAMPTTVAKVKATLWHHQTWEDKVTPAERLPKVAYRWQSGAHIATGNHDVWLPILGPTVTGLEIRHFQYRSYEHFCEKVADSIRRIPPEGRARGDGAHHTRLEGASEEQMAAAWQQLCDRPTVHDPIPYRR